MKVCVALDFVFYIRASLYMCIKSICSALRTTMLSSSGFPSGSETGVAPVWPEFLTLDGA